MYGPVATAFWALDASERFLSRVPALWLSCIWTLQGLAPHLNLEE